MKRLSIVLNHLKLMSDRQLCQGISECKSESNSTKEYAELCIKKAGGDVRDYRMVKIVSAEISDRLVSIYERYGAL